MKAQDIRASEREPMEHDLKIYSRHFEDVISGKKKAEQRVNDRDFKVGDTILLREVTESELRYTGRKIYVAVTHIIHGDGYDILSIEPQDTVSRCEISVVEEIFPCPYVNGFSADNSDVSYMLKCYAHYRDLVVFQDGAPARCFRLAETTKPVSVSLKKCADAVTNLPGYYEAHENVIKAVLDAAGVQYVD